MSTTELAELIDSKFRELREGSIVTGTIQEIRPQVVLVDIGYKSEGAISISEFEDEEIEVGDQIEVLLERLENDEGIVVLSKEKAAHKQNWDKIVGVYRDGGLRLGHCVYVERALRVIELVGGLQNCPHRYQHIILPLCSAVTFL